MIDLTYKHRLYTLCTRNGRNKIQRRNKPTLFQILYPFAIIDVEVYRKERIEKNIIWIGKDEKNKTITFPIINSISYNCISIFKVN